MHADLENRLLTGLADALLDLLFRLADQFLDASRVNPSVRNESLEGNAGDLAANGTVTRDNDGFRRIIDDQVDSGRGLDRPDVPTFPADDASLHVVAREMHHGNAALGDELSRETL